MIENVKEKRGAKREMFAVAGITLFLAPFQVAQAFSLLVLFALGGNVSVRQDSVRAAKIQVFPGPGSQRRSPVATLANSKILKSDKMGRRDGGAEQMRR